MLFTSFFKISNQLPERLTKVESWHRHIPFSFAILHMLKPRIFVELGTHRGDSYSAFCQGVVQQKLATRCFAVDTWQGDAHAGEYCDEVFNDLRQWHDPRYNEFSSLLRMTFDQALEHFAGGSVDLLHIDGLHTYSAVKHDFESWLPKLSDRAVVLFHDTNVRYDDFGVWQLWAELKEQYPAFEFPFGFGLGVLAVGKQVPAQLLEFLEYAKTNSKQVAEYFYHLGDAAETLKKQAEIGRLQALLGSVGQQLEHAREVVVERDKLLEQVKQQSQHAQQSWKQERQELISDIESARHEALECSDQVLALLRVQKNHRRLLQGQEHQLRMVLQSRIWSARNACMSLLGLGARRVDFTPLDLLPISNTHQLALEQSRPRVTIIVPVYKGLKDTINCIEAILNSCYKLDAELVVINDASPEPALVEWLEEHSTRFTLLHNDNNLGFVRTVNRGMSLYPQQDVVLVNSDTQVANDWLDRLQQAAYSAADIGTVTPFSNNATICSFPLFCQDNPLPEGIDIAHIDQIFARANSGQTVDIPTAVGFCMFIRRDCLLDSGLFDEVRFGRGYGEENEFCMRAAVGGWRHVLAGDVYVYHKGGVSFAETQSEHQQRGHAALIRLFPDYDWVVQQHIAADPAARLRFAAEAAIVQDSKLPVILMVNHGRGGGSQRHMLELAGNLKRHAYVYGLQPEGGLLRLQPIDDKGQSAALYFTPDQNMDLLTDTLRQLNTVHIHYHHVIDLPVSVLRLPEILVCTYDITIHDFYSACPQVTLTDEAGLYCGAPNPEGCNECLRKRPVKNLESIQEWRANHIQFLGGAERVFVPSRDALQRIERYFPSVGSWVLAQHESSLQRQVQVMPLTEDEPMRVLILGALSVFKGADVLEAVALTARAKRLPLEFHLFGYGYRDLRTYPVSNLHVHGSYNEEEIQALIQKTQPHVAWFPGSCPETWSYTLSTALEAKLPVMATNIGAFPERLAGREWSWLLPPNSSAEKWAEGLLQFRKAIVQQDIIKAPESKSLAVSSYIYSRDYFSGLSAFQLGTEVGEIKTLSLRSSAGDNTNNAWVALHARWAELSNKKPAADLLPQVENKYVRNVLVYALRRGWLQPALTFVPSTVQLKLKQILTRK